MGRELSETGIKFITAKEGKRSKMYKDSVGIWTIGVGHAISKDENEARRLFPRDLSELEIEQLLRKDLERFCRAVEASVSIGINDNQFAALVSLAFNIGVTAFTQSTLVKHLNLGKFAEAANQFLVWNKGTVNGQKVVIQGLSNRRAAEKELFLKAVNG